MAIEKRRASGYNDETGIDEAEAFYTVFARSIAACKRGYDILLIGRHIESAVLAALPLVYRQGLNRKPHTVRRVT